MWRGQTCFIVGGGPSVTRADVSHLEGRRVIVVNRALTIAPWADILFFWDCGFWTTWLSDIRAFNGLRVTACERHRDSQELHVLRRDLDQCGIGTDPSVIRFNKSSGACAIELARHLGAKRIVLVGFDMRQVGRRHNFHNDYPNPTKRPDHDKYAAMLEVFPQIATDLAAQEIECINATPGSAITQFPVMTLDEALAQEGAQACAS